MAEAEILVAFDGPDDLVPRYQTAGSAGADLFCAAEEMTLAPRERRLVPTGIRVAIPPGYEGQVRPRSGLASKNGVTVVNAPGTIDSDYRGEVKVALINLSDESFACRRGDRIAQLVIAPVTRAEFRKGPLNQTSRGDGGFGSTG